MIKLTEVCFAVQVERDAEDFHLNAPYRTTKYFSINYKLPKESNEYFSASGSFPLLYKDFGGKKKYPSQLEILGKVDANSIGFDCSGLVEKSSDGFYFDYQFEKCFCLSEINSFYSLLQSKNINITDQNKFLIIRKIN